MNVYMKEKTRVFCQNSFDDLDDNIGIVMPILTECDVDEDFTEGIEKVGDTIPILPLRNMVLFPGVALPVIIGRPKSMRLIKEAVHKKSLIGVVCQKEMDTEDPSSSKSSRARGLVASRLSRPRASSAERCACTVLGEERPTAEAISRTLGG